MKKFKIFFRNYGISFVRIFQNLHISKILREGIDSQGKFGNL